MYVNDIVISPADSQRVYAATRTGVWRSLDGDVTWSRLLDPQSASPGESASRVSKRRVITTATCRIVSRIMTSGCG
jgi:hypothetical protein